MSNNFYHKNYLLRARIMKIGLLLYLEKKKLLWICAFFEVSIHGSYDSGEGLGYFES